MQAFGYEPNGQQVIIGPVGYPSKYKKMSNNAAFGDNVGIVTKKPLEGVKKKQEISSSTKPMPGNNINNTEEVCNCEYFGPGGDCITITSTPNCSTCLESREKSNGPDGDSKIDHGDEIKKEGFVPQDTIPSSEWDSWSPTNITIDFTPTPEDEEQYDKCVDFWNMINSRTDIQHLKVIPDEKTNKKENQRNDEKKYFDVKEITKCDVISTTQEAENLLLQQRLQKNMMNYPALVTLRGMKSDLLRHALDINKVCQSNEKSYTFDQKYSDDVKVLCHDMDEFDKKHPNYDK